jgi:hypothetical protein
VDWSTMGKDWKDKIVSKPKPAPVTKPIKAPVTK